jgi:hypothetical protein
MVEYSGFPDDSPWEAGFEADRRVVVAQWGPFKRVFPRPQRYARRFYHQVHELRIEDWRIPLEPLRLGPFCTMAAVLSIRFQPTLKFAREHLDRIDDLGGYIRGSYQALIQDAAELELKQLESVEWLDHGYTQVERLIENLVHELLAMRDIQCRCRCDIETTFAAPEGLDDHAATADSRHHKLYLELLRRRQEITERLAREHYERQLHEQRLKLEHEERLLELLRRETELRRLRQENETERMRAELQVDELRSAEHFESEMRLREERIHHEARLRQIELEADLAEKALRAEALDDVENHLKREIELLALERQRILLEEEIHDAKVARAKGWVINARRRFPLGEEQKNPVPQEAEISKIPPTG